MFVDGVLASAPDVDVPTGSGARRTSPVRGL